MAIRKVKLPNNSTQDLYDSRIATTSASDNGKVLGVLNGSIAWVTPDTEVFWCTYGTTTQTEIQAAVTAGKLPACKYNDNIYLYAGESSAGYSQFTSVLYNIASRIYVKNSTWGNASFTVADSSAVHSIPSGGTSGQVLKKSSGTDYAVEWADESGGGGSANAVLYTQQTLTTAQKTQARTNIAAVGYNVTGSGTPVALGLEQTTNKVTSLSSSSTDTQYPSAKCVYDYIDDTVGDIATLLAAI